MDTALDCMAQRISSGTADTIAQLALSTFATLPRSFKPAVRSNGVPEWTILASIVLSVSPLGLTDTATPKLRLISLGTGVKCLPTNKLPTCGDALHDSHAEVLAKRGLGRFLLEEAAALSAEPKRKDKSEVFELLDGDGRYIFRMRKGVGVHLYVSALPCGNASTLYTAAHQPRAMADLKDSNPHLKPPDQITTTSRGRNGYSDTSSLRTKPGRPDSFPSISMSCSDKIASWNVLGLQGGLLARWFEPVYIDSVIIGGVGEEPIGADVVGLARAAGESEVSEGWEAAIRREVGDALYGRLHPLESRLPHPYHLSRPEIHFTHIPFPYDKSTVSALHPSAEPSPHPSSVLHYLTSISDPPQHVSEHLFNGVDRRATWKAPGLTPIEEKRRSGVCKLEIMRAGVRLDAILRDKSDGLAQRENQATYHEMKQGTEYQAVKVVLRGQPGEPRLVQGFEKCGLLKVTESIAVEVKENPQGSGGDAPFTGWIVSGEKWESFDSDAVILGPAQV